MQRSPLEGNKQAFCRGTCSVFRPLPHKIILPQQRKVEVLGIFFWMWNDSSEWLISFLDDLFGMSKSRPQRFLIMRIRAMHNPSIALTLIWRTTLHRLILIIRNGHRSRRCTSNVMALMRPPQHELNPSSANEISTDNTEQLVLLEKPKKEQLQQLPTPRHKIYVISAKLALVLISYLTFCFIVHYHHVPIGQSVGLSFLHCEQYDS